ncbi:thymidylate kinase [Streptomyces brevispora]|uniref:Thymidylate kinase n=1 Tax=Streptomyces brevispora TaxID=887462 RepID=A0A561V5P6_9ACTN|nr:hypothetical protein [Streptomyces brevispora]TWG06913.1 thymidylate kinase [Streptomyces brevispora]
MFVALVGPDGVGKTTVAGALERAARARGRRFAYVHWIPTTVAPPVSMPCTTVPPPPKRTGLAPAGLSHRVLSVGRLCRNLVRFWAGYVMGMRRHVAGLRGPDVLVVADRWMYNYIAQPVSVAYHGPPTLARLAVWLAPRPDLTIVLDAPADVIVARKQELTLDEAESELGRWRQLSPPNAVAHLDATLSPDVLAKQILDVIA